MIERAFEDRSATVLVPVDFGEASRRAVAWAVDYASRVRCDLHLLHVVEPSVVDLLAQGAHERIENEIVEVTRAAEAAIEQNLRSRDVETRPGSIVEHVIRGRAVPEILRLASHLDAELIVMGTEGRTGIDRIVGGSVAEQIVRRAHCPVVCVKA